LHRASGTSFSAPLVSGVVANFLSYVPWGQSEEGAGNGKGGVRSVEDVYKWIVETESTKNVVKGFMILTPNRVLFSRVEEYTGLPAQRNSGNGGGGQSGVGGNLNQGRDGGYTTGSGTSLKVDGIRLCVSSVLLVSLGMVLFF
jgi:hypothetical protein